MSIIPQPYVVVVVKVSLFCALTEPGVIQDLAITGVTESSVSVSWTAPQGNVDTYTVRWSSAGGAGDNYTTSDTSHTINGLSPGVLYNVTVAAVAGPITNEGARASASTFTRKSILCEINDNTPTALFYYESGLFNYQLSWMIHYLM